MKSAYEMNVTPEFKGQSDLDIIMDAVDNPQEKVKEMMSRHGNINPWAACVNTLFNSILGHAQFLVLEKKALPSYETRIRNAVTESNPLMIDMITQYPVPKVPPEEVQITLYRTISALKPTQEELI